MIRIEVRSESEVCSADLAPHTSVSELPTEALDKGLGFQVDDEVYWGPGAGTWRPLSVADVRPFVLDGPAWLSGGIALDAWLGFQSRQHDDVDASVLRGQLPDFASQLPLWLCLYAAEEGLLEDGDDEQWTYRRCHDVTASWNRAVLTVDGLRIVAPEILEEQSPDAERRCGSEFDCAATRLDSASVARERDQHRTPPFTLER